MAKKRYIFIGILALIAGVIILAYSGQRTVSGPEKLNFRLKWIFYSSFGEHLIAHKMGLFTKENIDLQMRAGGAGLDPLKLVASGEDDVGLASYGQILMACEKGLPIVAIGQSNTASGVVFISLRSSGITKPEQFVGKKVGFIPGSDTGSVYQAVMTKLGIDRSKIEEVPIGFSVDPLLNRSIDVSTAAFSTNQPLAIESKGIAVNIIDPKNYGVEVGGNVFFTRVDLLKKNPDLLRRFLRADLSGVIMARKMRDEEVVDTVLQYNPILDRKAELNIWKATKRALLPETTANMGMMPEATWRQTNDVFSASGLTSQSLDYRKCYTNDLVKGLF